MCHLISISRCRVALSHYGYRCLCRVVANHVDIVAEVPTRCRIVLYSLSRITMRYFFLLSRKPARMWLKEVGGGGGEGNQLFGQDQKHELFSC